MTLWAIVPVKPLRRGKSRLSGILSEDERADLNRKLLQHTLETLNELREVEEVLVVSRDPQVLTIARSYGARTVREDGQPDLNTALRRATAIASYRGAARIIGRSYGFAEAPGVSKRRQPIGPTVRNRLARNEAHSRKVNSVTVR